MSTLGNSFLVFENEFREDTYAHKARGPKKVPSCGALDPGNGQEVLSLPVNIPDCQLLENIMRTDLLTERSINFKA